MAALRTPRFADVLDIVKKLFEHGLVLD